MEEIVNVYRAELARVQAERDAALASERRLWAAVAELREMVGLLQSTFDAARNEAAENDAKLSDATFETVQGDVGNCRERFRNLLATPPAA